MNSDWGLPLLAWIIRLLVILSLGGIVLGFVLQGVCPASALGEGGKCERIAWLVPFAKNLFVLGVVALPLALLLSLAYLKMSGAQSALDGWWRENGPRMRK